MRNRSRPRRAGSARLFGFLAARRRLEIALLAAAAELAAGREQQHGGQQDPRHRHFLRARRTASRTRRGAVPPALVRLATERSTLSTE